MKSFPIKLSLLILASLLVVLFYYFSFYPGYMSFDSAKQYSQVVSGEWNTISPIIMVLLWTFTDKIITGPGGLFIFFLVIFNIGILLFTINLKLSFYLKVTIILVISLWPFNLMIIPHLWKDIGLVSFLVLAIGFIQTYINTGKLFSLYLALSSLIIASLFRFESILYIMIIEFYVIILLIRHFRSNKVKLKATVLSLLVVLLSFTISQGLVSLSKSTKITLWQSVALWDLARVSVKIDDILLPQFTIGPSMNIDDLSKAVVPWTNTHLFTKTKAGMNSGLEIPYKKEQYSELFNTWITMIISHPVEYLTHRFEVTRDLLRVKDSSKKPIDIFFSRRMKDYSDEFTLNNSSINLKITELISNNKGNIIFKGWFYFLLEILIVLYLLIAKMIKNNEFLVFISLSGVVSTIVLAFVAPSAEQRYLIWLINSTLFTFALLMQKNNLEDHK